MIITDQNLKVALNKAIDNSVWKKEGKGDKVRKFDESLDIIVNFRDLDIKNPQNRINLEFLLPHPIFKFEKQRICFITDGDQLIEVKEKGYNSCDKQFLADLNKKDKKLKKNFVKRYDSFICRADMMRDVARVLGRFLGQSGKMPKPQPKGYGIVQPNVKVDNITSNFERRVIVATKKAPIVQAVFGKKSIDSDKNFENLKGIINFIESQLPNGPGNIKSIYLKTSMGKPSKVEEPASKSKRGDKK
jgi:large subunit ribosomal protein L1